MAMVNMNNLLNGKDSRWLQLEVCREFQRNKCTRPDTECKFAHPPANVEVQNGRVTACYDSIKGRCNREKPPCKYFHPPQHLKDQLLINGRNHLALKNALMQQMGLTPGQTLVPGQVPTVESPAPTPPHHHLQQQIQQQLLATHAFMATNPYLTGMPQVGNTYSPYFAPSPIMPAIMGPADPTGVGSPLGVVQQTVAMPQKMPRTDRLEMDMKSVGSFYYENFAFPGMVPYKRPAGDKSGVPVYQPTGATTYQQLMQLQQPFVPVSCEYTGTPPLPAQSSNHQSVQNTIQSQGAAVNADTNGHGLLLDPNNPPPPPPAASSGDKQLAANHDTDNTQNSPELNHATSPQMNHQLALPPPSMSPMTSMAMTSMPNVVSMNPMVSMASMANMANMTSMANYTMANMANINVLSSLGMGPCLSLDPAAIAKEVAQKNYAKAIKLSQASQSYAMNHPLNALNYTGVSLNKQALSVGNPHGAIPGTAAPRQVMSGLAGIHGGGLTSHQLHQAGLLAYPRQPSNATFNPYSLIRQQMLPSSHPYMQTSLQGVPTASVHSAYLQNPYATMLPGVAGVQGVASQMQGLPQLPTASPATIAAQPQVAMPNSSGVIMQPYKKMKTT
ncbi:uncharacterized protein LOC117178064 isoform X3 [Belonocnema kinseyi]|uniref:uncharacterized protein LOC117178064 isoform X3 n=1 Tax=Belonocnema kinseyi TaxID=2817044 RepID=UPI00143D2DE5|nr:uncharacterized protein LOC117178064 isoform X3 [Belonocnema kinseyi]